MILEAYSRVFVEADALDRTVAFYKTLTGGSQSLRFDYPEMGLTLVALSSTPLSVLVIAGPSSARGRFQATALTLRVDDLDAARLLLEREGAAIIEAPNEVPTGRNMRARHPDGLVVEYVQHRSPARA
jgi:predicted enzyme related to lactoylglutathione lyase